MKNKFKAFNITAHLTVPDPMTEKELHDILQNIWSIFMGVDVNLTGKLSGLPTVSVKKTKPKSKSKLS